MSQQKMTEISISAKETAYLEQLFPAALPPRTQLVL